MTEQRDDGNGGERSTLSAWIAEELVKDRARASSKAVLDVCADAMAVGGPDWEEISSVLKNHDSLGLVLEALHRRGERGETARWVDAEIRKDRSAATHKEVVEVAWDAMQGDGKEWDEVGDVLKEHGVFDAVLEVVQREHTGEVPENPPAPTDDDKRKHDPRRPGGPLDPEQDLTFRVSRIRKVDSRPAVYYVQIDGAHELRMGISTLMSPTGFGKVFTEELNRIPMGIPRGKGSIGVWEDLLNRWLNSMLVVEEQPAESSEGGLIRHTIREILDELSVGEDVEDLDHGRVLAHKDGFMVKQRMLLKLVKVRTGITTIKTEQVGEQLQHSEIGAVFKRLRVGGRQVRVWIFKRENREKEEGHDGSQLLVH